MAKKRARKVEDEEEEVNTPEVPTVPTPALTRDSDVPVKKKLKVQYRSYLNFKRYTNLFPHLRKVYRRITYGNFVES